MNGVATARGAHGHAGGAVARTGSWLLAAGVIWGAFAFGAVYPWAYWPLAILAAIVASLGLTLRTGARRFEPLFLAIPLAAFLVAIQIQLTPIRRSLAAAVSPSTIEALSQLDPKMQGAGAAVHTLSIAPAQTLTGLLVFGSFALLLFGGSRLFSAIGVRGTARAIAVIGVVLAFAGIIQQPLSNGEIYGFWTPEGQGLSYGPFVNRNHFAGWMLMALPVVLGLLCAQVERGARDVRSGFRDKVLWLSSPEASGIALLAAGALVMTVALVLTMSRSGMTSAALAVAGIGVLSLRGQATRMKKFASVAIIAAIVTLAVAWIGASVISARFASANWSEFNDRKGAWQDAIAIAKRFPLVGTGFNTYGVATLIYQRHDLEQHYAQAHNDYLQLLAEGGLLLAIPAAACVIALALAIRRRFRQETSATTYWIRAGAVTGLCAIAVQEIVEFSLQMPGNAFLFVVLCAIALHATPERRQMRVAETR